MIPTPFQAVRLQLAAVRALTLAQAGYCAVQSPSTRAALLDEPIRPLPDQTSGDPERIALGQRLFQVPRRPVQQSRSADHAARAVRQLREQIRSVKMAHGGTQEEALYSMEKGFVDKEDLVEQFKSQNAVLQNSLRYFPTAVEEFKAQLREHRNEWSARAATQRTVAAIDRLLTDILRFNLMPDQDLGDRISTAINELESGQGEYPDAVSETYSLMIRHARIIREQREIEDALISRIISTPTAPRIDALNMELDEAFQEKLHDRQLYRLYLFVYSAFLLARQSAQLEELATHDTLTGLINRRHLMTQIEQAMVRAERRGWGVALMFIDLDGFKVVNDIHGHAAGERVLQEVAVRLKRHVCKEDAFARLGGDEVVILLNEVSGPQGPTRLTDAVLEELHSLRAIDGQAIRLSASIGISLASGATGPMLSPETLLSQADQAVYRAKQQGKGCYRFSNENASCLEEMRPEKPWSPSPRIFTTFEVLL